MTTKRINIAIDETFYNHVVELARREKRTPANFLSLFVETNLGNLLAHLNGQQQLQQQPAAE